MTVSVLWLFLLVPLVGLMCAILAFPGHLIFVSDKDNFFSKYATKYYTYVNESFEVYLITKHGKISRTIGISDYIMKCSSYVEVH